MSWKPEVIADNSGKWAGNALRFATEQEAKDNVAALKNNWWLVTDTRVVEVDEPVTHRWTDTGLVSVEEKPKPLHLVTNQYGVDEWVR